MRKKSGSGRTEKSDPYPVLFRSGTVGLGSETSKRSLGHLIRSRADTKSVFFSEKVYFPSGVRNMNWNFLRKMFFYTFVWISLKIDFRGFRLMRKKSGSGRTEKSNPYPVLFGSGTFRLGSDAPKRQLSLTQKNNQYWSRLHLVCSNFPAGTKLLEIA